VRHKAVDHWPRTIRTARRLSLVLIVGGCGDPAPPTAVAAPDGNLVRNFDFEGGGGVTPSEWTLDGRVASRGTVALAPSPLPGGGQCVRLAPNAGNRIRSQPFAIGQGFDVRPFRGHRLRLAGRLRAQGEAVAVLGLYVIRKDGGFLEGVRLRCSASSRDKENLREALLAVPDDPEAVALIISCGVEGASGEALFDDIYVGSPSESANGTVSRGETSTKEAMPAVVTINTEQELRRITPALYGMNMEWIYDGYGLWDSQRKGLHEGLAELTQAMGVGVLRFPGGVFSDYYNWRDGVGPIDKRRATPHVPGGPKSRHSFGTDEARAFARRVGADLLLTVNAGTGTAAEAAAWVRYVNEGKDGGDLGPVRNWEVGNELYGRGGASDAIAVTPELYATRFLEFAAAMRSESADIRVGAIGLENYGRYQMNAYSDWNRIVLEKAGGAMDFLAVHNAYAPMVFEDSGDDVSTVYAAMLAAPVLIARNLADVSRQIEQFAPSHASRISIAVTEWGPWFHAVPDSRFVDHSKTLGSALFVASTLAAFVRAPRVQWATAFKLVDNAYLGWIGLRGGEYAPKAPYYALQLFSRHFGTRVVTTTTQSPTYDSPGVGLVAAVEGVPYLDVVSSLSDDGNTLFVIVVNRHFTASITTQFTLEGFAPVEAGAATVLNGTGIDAHTGTELPKIPGLKWARQSSAVFEPRFERGGPDEVGVRTMPLCGVATSFSHVFPAHSVTALELHRR